jgi:hypothetical protein
MFLLEDLFLVLKLKFLFYRKSKSHKGFKKSNLKVDGNSAALDIRMGVRVVNHIGDLFRPQPLRPGEIYRFSIMYMVRKK